MLKEMLQYVVSLKEPVIREIRGNTYSDKPLNRIFHIPYAEPLLLDTLTSLVNYIKWGVDFIHMPENMLVHVKDPDLVFLYSALDAERKRECLAEVKARHPSFPFGEFMEQEKFCIAMRSQFVSSNDRELLMSFAGTVEAGTVAEYGDDGISQKATVRTGISGLKDAAAPSPVTLAPYRTFHEVSQPESSFIFRMRQGRDGGVQCALFEADGGAWRNEAMARVKEYLRAELPEFTVIS